MAAASELGGRMEERNRSAVSRTPLEPTGGRHLAIPDRRWGPGWVVVAAGLVVLVGVVLVARVLGAAEPRSRPAPTATSDVLGSVPRPPARPSVFGNLVSNWSFEQDLRGWEVTGPATASQEPGGRTSGSSAAVRATGDQPAQVGLVLPKVVPAAPRGSRYVASAWVRSTSPGLRVSVRLVTSGAGVSQASQATDTTLPGDSWRRVTVRHTVAVAQAALDLQVTAAAVPPGEALIVDEVELRKA
jgi:Carbohydrate binding domain